MVTRSSIVSGLTSQEKENFNGSEDWNWGHPNRSARLTETYVYSNTAKRAYLKSTDGGGCNLYAPYSGGTAPNPDKTENNWIEVKCKPYNWSVYSDTENAYPFFQSIIYDSTQEYMIGIRVYKKNSTTLEWWYRDLYGDVVKLFETGLTETCQFLILQKAVSSKVDADVRLWYANSGLSDDDSQPTDYTEYTDTSLTSRIRTVPTTGRVNLVYNFYLLSAYGLNVGFDIFRNETFTGDEPGTSKSVILNGVNELPSGSTSGDIAGTASRGNGYKQSLGAYMEASVQLDSVANNEFFFGFGETLQELTASDEKIGIKFDAAVDTDWRLVIGNGTADETFDTGVTVSADTWYNLRVMRDPDDDTVVHGWINGEYFQFNSGKSAAVDMYSMYYVKTTTASEKKAFIDALEIGQDKV